MLIEMLYAKIHGLTCTHTELYYEGSLTLDRNLLDLAGLLPGQKVQVVNVNNGARFETYLIEAPRQSARVCLNGPAARMASVGDSLHVIAYAQLEQAQAAGHTPRVLRVDKQNRPL